MAAPAIETRNSFLRCCRSAARQGSRFMRGMSVEAPQREAACGQQRRRVPVDALRLGAARDLHLAERLAAQRLDTDAAANHVRYARDVSAAAADEYLIRLLAAAARSEEELQRAAHLLRHVVHERVEYLGLVVARQAAFFLRAARVFHAEPVGAHDFLGQLLAAEREVARVDDFQIL